MNSTGVDVQLAQEATVVKNRTLFNLKETTYR